MYSNIEKALTINWQSNTLVQTANPQCDFFNKSSSQEVDNLKDRWRLPWDMLDYENLYDMQYHITINPDPQCDWITSCNDLKIHNIRFRQFIREAEKYLLYSNIISVYEYGKRGKEYGKVHWHILLQTTKIDEFIKMAIKYFGTDNNKRWKNTIINKKITIDKSLRRKATKEEKVDNYKSQIDYIIKKYMKKETHNRIKCLYSNMKKIN